MATFLTWSLPMPVVASAGRGVALSTILKQSFGGTPNAAPEMWLTYTPSAELRQWNSSYWNPSAPSVAKWYVDGRDIGGGWSNQENIDAADAGSAMLVAGNNIGAYAYVTVSADINPYDYARYIQYSVPIVEARLRYESRSSPRHRW